MTRSEKRLATENKRAEIAQWIFEIVKKEFQYTKSWDSVINKASLRIQDRIENNPQDKELIIQSIKLFRDKMNSNEI